MKLSFSEYGTTVTIDGVRIPSIRSVRIGHTAGDIPHLFLDILPEGGVHVMGEVEIEQGTWSRIKNYVRF